MKRIFNRWGPQHEGTDYYGNRKPTNTSLSFLAGPREFSKILAATAIKILERELEMILEVIRLWLLRIMNGSLGWALRVINAFQSKESSPVNPFLLRFSLSILDSFLLWRAIELLDRNRNDKDLEEKESDKWAITMWWRIEDVLRE